MRKCDKKRLQRVRHHEKLCAAKNRLEMIVDELGLRDKDNTLDDFVTIAKKLSNKHLRALTDEGVRLSHNEGFNDQEIVDALVNEFTERKMKLEEEKH